MGSVKGYFPCLALKRPRTCILHINLWMWGKFCLTDCIKCYLEFPSSKKLYAGEVIARIVFQNEITVCACAVNQYDSSECRICVLYQRARYLSTCRFWITPNCCELSCSNASLRSLHVQLSGVQGTVHFIPSYSLQVLILPKTKFLHLLHTTTFFYHTQSSSNYFLTSNQLFINSLKYNLSWEVCNSSTAPFI